MSVGNIERSRELELRVEQLSTLDSRNDALDSRSVQKRKELLTNLCERGFEVRFVVGIHAR